MIDQNIKSIALDFAHWLGERAALAPETTAALLWEFLHTGRAVVVISALAGAEWGMREIEAYASTLPDGLPCVHDLADEVMLTVNRALVEITQRDDAAEVVHRWGTTDAMWVFGREGLWSMADRPPPEIPDTVPTSWV